METQLAWAAALYTEPSGPMCCINNGCISMFLSAETPYLHLNAAWCDATFLFRLNIKMSRLEESDVQGDKAGFPQTVTILFERRLCVLLGTLPFTNRIFCSHTKRPTAFKHTLVHSAFHIPPSDSMFHLAFIVILGCFGLMILRHPIIFFCCASTICLSLKIYRLLPSSTSLENVLVSFYTDPLHYSTQGSPTPLTNSLFCTVDLSIISLHL